MSKDHSRATCHASHLSKFLWMASLNAALRPCYDLAENRLGSDSCASFDNLASHLILYLIGRPRWPAQLSSAQPARSSLVSLFRLVRRFSLLCHPSSSNVGGAKLLLLVFPCSPRLVAGVAAGSPPQLYSPSHAFVLIVLCPIRRRLVSSNVLAHPNPTQLGLARSTALLTLPLESPSPLPPPPFDSTASAYTAALS